MQDFLSLYSALERTQSTSKKVEILAHYLADAPMEEAVWVLYLFLGRRQKRTVSRKTLQEALMEAQGLPPWLFEECYATVGDLAETISLLLDSTKGLRSSPPLSQWMLLIQEQLRLTDPETQKQLLQQWWREYPKEEIFLITKLITGGMRIGLAKNLLMRALAKAFDKTPEYVAEQFMGEPTLTVEWLKALRDGDSSLGSQQRPYPFYLASPIDQEVEALGSVSDYALEWKWDGIRAQLVKRGDQLALWSRGEEWLNESFPEILKAARELPGNLVLDGELLIEREGQIQSFAVLQKRIMRKKLNAKILAESPAIFMAFDCLEAEGLDLRPLSQRERRSKLEQVLTLDRSCLQVSPLQSVKSWQEAAQLRLSAAAHGVEGLMLKEWHGPYRQGRKRGAWWKWKLDPMTLDAVLIYAQAGHGRRATQFTDYTFALWKDGELVPFAKAYSGLDQAEITELDRWIKAHTLQKFGPVRSVEPQRVFEIAFEGIQASTRHKSGIAVRFPRILRERNDKQPEQADSVERAKELIDGRR